MFRNCGPNIQIFLDYDKQQLRVKKNTLANTRLSWCEPQWEEVASFENAADWDKSPFPSQVTDESMQEGITYFWIDMHTEREPTT